MIPVLTITSIISTFLYLCLGVLITSICYPLTKSKFQLSYHKNPKNQRRIDRCPTIKRGLFIPTPYLTNGLLQATFGKFSKYSCPNIQFKEELLSLPCGGKIGLHWASQVTVSEKAKANEKKVIVMMLPGLTASSSEPYIRNISTEALENGYKVVVYQNRGNRIEMVLPAEGHMDQFMDVKHAVDHIKQKYPDYKLFAVGHSYGANTLINYMGKFQDGHKIDVAASIANPFDFIKAAVGIHGTMFDKFLAETMQGFARRNEKALLNAPKHLNLDLDKAMKATTLQGFDEHVTRRIYGFPDVESYYRGICSADKIPSVNIPMMILASKDDPVINYISCPVEASLKNENIIVILTHNGGHVGWFEGFFKPRRWYPKPTIEFLNSCYEEMI